MCSRSGCTERALKKKFLIYELNLKEKYGRRFTGATKGTTKGANLRAPVTTEGVSHLAARPPRPPPASLCPCPSSRRRLFPLHALLPPLPQLLAILLCTSLPVPLCIPHSSSNEICSSASVLPCISLPVPCHTPPVHLRTIPAHRRRSTLWRYSDYSTSFHFHFIQYKPKSFRK